MYGGEISKSGNSYILGELFACPDKYLNINYGSKMFCWGTKLDSYQVHTL